MKNEKTKHTPGPTIANMSMQDSPVEIERRLLPTGNGDWPGFDHVSQMISKACENMGRSRDNRLSDLHITSMAILGCGHEETMKAHMAILSSYGWTVTGPVSVARAAIAKAKGE